VEQAKKLAYAAKKFHVGILEIWNETVSPENVGVCEPVNYISLVASEKNM
jgi:hypothetical protein